MKNIMRKCMAFLLSFSLMPTVMPLSVVAETADETEQEEVIAEEAAVSMTEADETIETEESGELPAEQEHMDLPEDDLIPAEPLPGDASVNAGIMAHRITDESLYVLPHQSATLALMAESAAGGLKFQWYERYTGKIIPGATNAAYSIEDIMKSDSYECRITDAANNKAELVFNVSVINGLYAQPKNGKNVVLTGYGKSVKLEAVVTADDMSGMTYRWMRMNGENPDSTSSTCTINNVTKLDYVYCFITDRYGNEWTLTFTIGVENHLKAQLFSDRYFVFEGNGLPLTPIVEADDMTGLKYSWGYNELDFDGNVISSNTSPETGDTLVLMDIHHDLDIFCRVTDRYDNYVYCSMLARVVPYGGVRFLYDRQYVEVNANDRLIYENDIGGKMTWSSSNESVLSVQDGKYYPFVSGVASVTGRNTQGREASTEFVVMFDDVIDSERYFFEPVYWALENQITTGTKPRLFSPDAKCTREQIVTFLWRMNQCPEPKKNITFTDVKKSDYFYKAVSWAAEQGITVGLNDGTGRFGVGQPCTREQCVTFLWRAAGRPATISHGPFKDNLDKSKYYYDAIGWAWGEDITVGVSRSEFGVGTTCTRAMIVTFIHRYVFPVHFHPE